jgi:hypothetical protein
MMGTNWNGGNDKKMPFWLAVLLILFFTGLFVLAVLTGGK